MIAYAPYGVDKNFELLAVIAITSKREEAEAALAERSKGCQ